MEFKKILKKIEKIERKIKNINLPQSLNYEIMPNGSAVRVKDKKKAREKALKLARSFPD